MELSMHARKELTRVTTRRYRGAGRQEKTRILNEFCASSGYNRAYAALLLRSYGRTTLVSGTSETVKLRGTKQRLHGGGRPRVFGTETARVLTVLWKRFGYIAAVRLVILIRSSIAAIRQDRFLRVTESIAADLRRISSSSVERILRPSREKQGLHGHCHTRPAGPLSAQIPVRTFGQWRNVQPGHVQLDTVGHEGGQSVEGCVFTLCLCDVSTGWTERRAIANRGIRALQPALEEIRSSLPFALLHLHPDNGSEFINHSLFNYCKNKGLKLSRSRAGRKNDNCYVEQKNFDTVRKLVGYARYDSPESVHALNELYRTQSLLQNYVYPSQKLLEKHRIGSRLVRRFDAPQTPATRLLAHPALSAESKRRIRAIQRTLNPLHLADRVAELQRAALATAHRFCLQAEAEEKSQ
jgi:hypothetical protein